MRSSSYPVAMVGLTLEPLLFAAMEHDQRLTVAHTIGEEGETGLPAVRLTARGEIDAGSAQVLTSAFDELIAGGAAVVVLDASHVEFMDSSGLRVIISAGNRLSETGGQLFIEGMSGAVQKVLEISGLIEQYRRHDSVE
jgi:anti-sigma B factor antagonist